MLKMKVGAITIGQSPRADVVQELLPLMGEQVELIQAGALDGLTREDIQAFAPTFIFTILISSILYLSYRNGSVPSQSRAKIH